MAWMPEPVWLEIGKLGLEYSAVYTALSFWIALLLFIRARLKRGEPSGPCADWVPYGIVGALVGARLGYFAFEIPKQFLAEPGGLLWHPGFSVHGAVWGLMLGTYLFARQHQLDPLATFDDLALAGAVGFMLTSLGALMTNDVVGVISDSSWAVEFPIYDEGVLSPPLRVPIFHLQVIWSAVLVGLAVLARRSRWVTAAPSGTLTALVLALVWGGLIALDSFKVEGSHVAEESYRFSWVVLDMLGLVSALVFLSLRYMARPSGANQSLVEPEKS